MPKSKQVAVHQKNGAITTNMYFYTYIIYITYLKQLCPKVNMFLSIFGYIQYVVHYIEVNIWKKYLFAKKTHLDSFEAPKFPQKTFCESSVNIYDY